MSNKPIFVATHPRACSTAFERVFMTRRNTLQCVHEPFGDAYYFGPERLAARYENDEKARMESGFSESTYQAIFDRINKENSEGKRLFVKDMAQYLIPPNGGAASIAPSLVAYKRGVGTDNGTANGETVSSVTGGNLSTTLKTSAPPADDATKISKSIGVNGSSANDHPAIAENKNPTVIPETMLRQFMFTFLIRHPRNSIPSFYRCTIPPLDKVTGFYNFRPDEAGYNELRRLFDYLREVGQIGPGIAGQAQEMNGTNGTNGLHDETTPSVNGSSPANGTNGVHEGSTSPVNESPPANGTNGPHDGAISSVNGESNAKVDICVVDADDLLDNPSGIIEAFCNTVGIPFEPGMLKWDNEKDHQVAKEAFEKWNGFHDDAIGSTELKARTHKNKAKSDEEYHNEWVQKYGEEGAKTIKECVDANVDDYEYLKQFTLKVASRPPLLN